MTITGNKGSKQLVKQVKDTSEALKEARQLNDLETKATKLALKDKSLSGAEKKALKQELKEDQMKDKQLKQVGKVTKNVYSDIRKDAGFLGRGEISETNQARAKVSLGAASKTLSAVSPKLGSGDSKSLTQASKDIKKETKEAKKAEKKAEKEANRKETVSRAGRLVNLVAPGSGKAMEMLMD